MSGMTNVPTELEQLCEVLFGVALDPAEVAKAMPDQSDVSVRNAKLRRNVERGSNAVGIAAGTLGLSAALKDERLKDGGRVAQRLYRTGQRMPSIVGRIKSPRAQAGLAGLAVGTQVANLGGDALIAGTLGKPQKHPRQRKQVTSKRAPRIPRDVRPVVDGLRRLWNPPPPPASAATVPGSAVPKAPGATGGPRGAAARQAGPKPAAAPAAAQPQTRAGVREARKTQAKATQQATDRRRAAATGSDVASMLSTTSGKVATGTLATAGALKATGGRRQGYEYVPDTYAYGKRDDGIEFRGEFTKFDDEKRQAFGWASIVKVDGAPVIDKQGDYISIEDLEEAAYTYVHKSRVGGDMHKRNGDAPHHVSDMIESIVFTPEKISALKLPEDFPQGWWVGYQIHDEDTWDEVRKRGRTGFSIHGRGIRRSIDVDELMGAR